jgi:SPP1 family predicted phage head-tail adaptor
MNEYPHTITIQNYVETEDEGGGLTQEWRPYTQSEAFVVPVGGREFYQAQQTTNPADYDVFIPYREDILPSMRVVFRGKIMGITAVIPALIDINGDYEKLNLKCSL